jgi:putative transposase
MSAKAVASSCPSSSGDRDSIAATQSSLPRPIVNVMRRTIEDTWRHLGHLLETIKPQECANYFQNPDLLLLKHETL